MKLTNKITILVLVASTYFLSACHELGNKGIREGIMKYEITYLEEEGNNPLITLLPEELEMKFKDNSVLLVVKGWMGIFESTFIKQASTGKTISTLKVMNKRYYYQTDSMSSFVGSSTYKNVKVQFDDLEKQILNYKCKHATAIVPDLDLKFDIYYTIDIAIEKPNMNTMFYEIPGVLMEFQIEINGIAMQLNAKELYKCDIDNNTFDIPAGFTEVERQELDTIFSSLIKK